MRLNGAIVAMITPFKGEKLDEEGFLFLLERQLNANVDGIVVLGTTGETPSLSIDEQRRVIELAVKKAKGKVPIIVGTGTYSTKETIEMTKMAADLGADCALIVAPYYNKPSQEGVVRHFEAICSKVNLPIVLYNHPGRTGINIEVGTLAKIVKFPHIVGIKECSGNFALASEYIALSPDLALFSGDDVLTLPLMALGGKGVISVACNLVPDQMVDLVHNALKGDFEEAKRIHYELLDFFKATVLEGNPVPIKAALEICGLPSGGLRLPLCDLRLENRKALEKVIFALKHDELLSSHPM